MAIIRKGLLLFALAGTAFQIYGAVVRCKIEHFDNGLPLVMKVSQSNKLCDSCLITHSDFIRANAVAGKFGIDIFAEDSTAVYSGVFELQSATDTADVAFHRPLALNDIVVEGLKSRVIRRGRDYKITNVQATRLGSAGNLVEMFRWTPGVLVDANGGISVIGAGSPLVYVDGRKLVSDAQLQSYQSSDIKEIEIIRNPGLEYPSGTSAVIRLTTVKRLKDFVGATISNTVNIRKHVGDSPTLFLNAKAGKLSMSAYFGYTYGHTEDEQWRDLVVSESAATAAFSETSHQTYIYKGHTFTPSVQLGYMPNNNNSLTINYSGTILDKTPDFIMDKMVEGSLKSIEKQDYSLWQHKSHNVSLGYVYDSGKNRKLNVALTYQRETNGIESDIKSTDVVSDVTLIKPYQLSQLSEVFTGDVDWSMKLVKWVFNIGGNYGYIRARSNQVLDETITNSLERDRSCAVYITARGSLAKNLTANFGLRYEGIYTDIHPDIDVPYKNRSGVIPRLNLRYSLPKGNSIGLTAWRSKTWPSIARLNPMVVYVDELRRKAGNPGLKTGIWTYATLDANIGNVSLGLSYGNTKNVTMEINRVLPDGIILELPINSCWKNAFNLDVDYELSFRRVEMYFSGFLNYDVWKIDQVSALRRKLWGGVSAEVNWSPIKNYEVFADIYYQTPCDWGVRRVGHQLSCDIGASARFLKGALLVSITGTDLFRRSVNPTDYFYSFNNISESVRHIRDLRGVRFKIRYRFDSVIPRILLPSKSSTATTRGSIDLK